MNRKEPRKDSHFKQKLGCLARPLAMSRKAFMIYLLKWGLLCLFIYVLDTLKHNQSLHKHRGPQYQEMFWDAYTLP